MTGNLISPKDYRAGFQASQREFEFFQQLTNRLKSIRATRQLKQGQSFLDSLELQEQRQEGK